MQFPTPPDARPEAAAQDDTAGDRDERARMLDRRHALGAMAGLGALALGIGFPGAAHAGDGGVPGPASGGDKRLRIAFNTATTGFDPAQISDTYSRTVTEGIYEALFKFDYLARPPKIVPCTAVELPEPEDDFRVWTIRIQPGIHFADDPAFNGQQRELTAADYVYSLKRFWDPANKSPAQSYLAQNHVLGMDELAQKSIEGKQPFDYDTEVEGLRAIDRYTLQIRLRDPRPRYVETLADSSLMGAVAREVIERYGDERMAHPVGTGPFMLKSWRRSSQIVLARNPGYREVLYDGYPAADDAKAQAFLAEFKGRRLPMIDTVEISIIQESQPQWLAFLNGQLDYAVVPLEFANLAAPGGELAPNLAKRGMQLERRLLADRTLFYFNMKDAVVGGMSAEKVALRRAISLAYDQQRVIELMYRNQAIPAQSVVSPDTWGYDPEYRSLNSEYDPARANALLDLYGYTDRNGDGWRALPDGSPLELRMATQTSAFDRALNEMWKGFMDRIGVRMRMEPAQWQENLKKARAGDVQMWSLGYTASGTDPQDGLEVLYGPAAGGQNLAFFQDERFDAIYRQMQSLPDGPERLKLLREAQALIAAYMPHKYVVHRIGNYLTQRWVHGFLKQPFLRAFWMYADVDANHPER